MRNTKPIFTVIPFVFLFLGFVISAVAGTLVRGPYLQTVTEDSIRIKWRTDLADSSIDTVHYGTTEDVYTMLSSATTVTVTCGVNCQALEHEAKLTGFTANTRYYYAIGSAVGPLPESGAKGSFVTSPISGTAKPTRIWVIGDSGTANANAMSVRNTYQLFTDLQPTDLWLMLGDNAYPDGTDSEYQVAVFDMYPDMLRNTPLWATLGNHDGHSADSETESGAYYDIFSFPKNAEAGGTISGTEAYYSFDYGNIHFICLDSYDTNRSSSGPMLTWLESDLMVTTQEWIIAFWHHPPYTKGSHNSDSEIRLIEMRENALPLLEQYGVDLVLSGHSHSYERSFLIDGHYGFSEEFNSNPSLLIDSGNGWPFPELNADGAYVNYTSAIGHKGAVYAVVGSSGKLTLGTPLNHPVMRVSLEKMGSLVLDVYGDKMDVTFVEADGTFNNHFTIVHDPETFPPAIVWAKVLDDTTVEVRFTETLDNVSAENKANYSIDGVISISNAVLSDDFRSVFLDTTALTAGTTYILTVSGVKDYRAGLAIPAPGIQTSFAFSSLTESFQNGVLPDAGYAGTRDTTLRETDPASNFASETLLFADGSDADPVTGVFGELVVVMAWDISTISSGAMIEDASLTLEITNISSGLYDLYEMKTTWQENTATWGSNGAVSDHGTMILGTLIPNQTGLNTVVLNADGRNLIKAWVNGLVANNGFVLVNRGSNDGVDFSSSEAALATRPKLEVTYALSVDNPGNNAPTLAMIVDQNVDEGEALNIPLSATDPDNGDTLTLSATGLPAFAGLTDNGDGSGSITVNPGFSDAGIYHVTVTVNDFEGLTDSELFNIIVADASLPTMHIDSVLLQKHNAPKKKVYASAEVTIRDAGGVPVGNTSVNGEWSGDFDQSLATGVTDGSGIVIFDSVQIPRSDQGMFIFTVTDVTKTNFSYDSATDITTSGCVDTTGADCGIDPENPPAPTDLTAFSAGGVVTLDWVYTTNADAFNIYRSPTTGSSDRSFLDSVTVEQYIDGAVVVGDTYYYVVTAIVGGIESVISKEVSVTVSNGLPPVMHVPFPFLVEVTGNGKNLRSVATVAVLDENNNPVADADVNGTWEVLTSDGQLIILNSLSNGTTNAGGVTIITSDKYRADSGDLFLFIVTGVTRSGFLYDAGPTPPFGKALVN